MNQTSFAQLKKAVFTKQKTLEEIYRLYGDESLFDYVNKRWTVNPAKISSSFLKLFEELLKKLYGQDVVSAAFDQLENYPLVSTIDHHGLLNHPFFLNSNLIFSLRSNSNIKCLICFSTSGISLNNSSWPGCLLINTEKGLKRFSFFSDRLKTRCVFSMPAIGPENVKKILQQIRINDFLKKPEKVNLEELIREIFTSDIYQLPNFSQQACLLSSFLWSKIFPQAPKVIYLPLEDLVSQIIIREIVPQPNHVLHQMLFTVSGWQLVEKYFQGTLGAFSSSHKGSFLFWGIDTKGCRVRLQREKSKIIHSTVSTDAQGGEQSRTTGSGQASQNSKLEWNLELQQMAEALEKRELYPTSLVCFLTLFYYQITCLGGFNQVNWLTDIKERFLKLLEEIEQKELADKIRLVETKNFAEANLAFLLRNDQLIKASGVDLYLTGKDYYQSYHQLAQEITLGESIESGLPEIYKTITLADQRKEELSAINHQDIAKFNGMEEKIKNFLSPD